MHTIITDLRPTGWSFHRNFPRPAITYNGRTVCLWHLASFDYVNRADRPEISLYETENNLQFAIW